ncbi:hypothetical protein pb186bvf_019949 [Paramecium bursaria]
MIQIHRDSQIRRKYQKLYSMNISKWFFIKIQKILQYKMRIILF